MNELQPVTQKTMDLATAGATSQTWKQAVQAMGDATGAKMHLPWSSHTGSA